MITVFWPSGTSSVTPSRTRFAPNDLVRPSSWIIGPSAEVKPEVLPHRGCCRTPRSQQHQRPERIQHQDRLAAEHHGPRGGLPDPLRPALGVEAAETAHQGDGAAEAGALDQAEPDILELVEELEPLEELGRRKVEQVDRGDPP